jgi:hypothetical protein
MTDKETNYFERHRYWQDQTINQLSTANNFMLTISIGLLAFCFDKPVFMKIRFCVCSCKIDWSLTLHFFALIFLTLAIMYGMTVLVTRLYDFRITRNIVLTRQRFYTENEKRITTENPNAAILSASEFTYPSFSKRISAIFKVIFIEIDLLTKSESLELKTNEHILNKFNSLRELSFTLGTISWRFPRFQALFFALATLLYMLSLWIQ